MTANVGEDIRTAGDAVGSLLGELARLGVRLKMSDDGQLAVSAPRGRLTSELRDRIGRHKPELLEWLRRTNAGDRAAERLPVIVPDEANLYRPFPPSDLQQSFIIGGQEGFEYYVRPHQYMEFDFDELDPARFEQALNAVLRRHRRSLVVIRDDMLMQTVRDPQPVRVTVDDLRHLPEPEVERRLAATRSQRCRQEPAHARWPWLEPHITRYGGGRARLHYNNNNIFTDAPSGAGLIAETMRRYHDPHLPLPELQLSYRDCVLALAELEESALGVESKRYWCERMADWPDAPDIPLVPGSAHRGRSRLCRRTMTMSARRWSALKRGAAERGLTATNALLSAHAEVLAYWSGSRHFLLNNMISHRPIPLHPQMPEVFGNFASLYPLEVDWRGDKPFRERAHRLQARVIADVAHSYWSGAKVLQTLNQVRRTPGRANCPFAVGSAFFAGPTGLPHFSMLETPQTLLDTEFWDLPDGQLLVIWDVIEAMFPPGLIDDMQAGFAEMIGQLAGDASAWDRTAFELLPPAQRRLRAELNRADSSAPDGLLHTPLARHAAAAPQRTAVVGAGTTITYAGLHQRATALANILAEHGVRAGDRVAVILAKRPDQVVAAHAVLTAGAAYVPIDPQWPADRIRYLIEDTGAGAVIGDPATLAGVVGVPVVAPGERAGAANRSFEPVQPDDLAYIIYTSGSTGRPKGAMLNHRGPVNTVADINRRFGIGAEDVVFGVSSLCFDLSVYDLYGTLAAGATLLLPEAGRSDPATWLDLVGSAGVTVWNSVPAIMQLFAEAALGAGRTFPALRTVLLSGDWIPVTLPDKIRRIAPNARVVSLGGATEASIWSICYPVDQIDPAWPSVPYGRPLANQTWHVLDSLGQDAPTWVTGELYIGGTGLALGYWGDDERTARAFVTHPRTGERLYRTGDLGRYLPTGDIEFLGRADFQMKIQGFRVEPGEIEHALQAHPDVARAVVVARQSGSGRQLAGFVVGADGRADPRPDALRRFLAETLPSYLVPNQIIVRADLPLTGNGKVDRRALATLAPDGQRDQVGYRPPGTATEAALAGIWESILGTGPVGIHDDFFDLGGQSFAALRAISMIADRLGRRVALGTLLERRTIAALAAAVDAGDDDRSPLTRLSADGPGPPWFLVHPAGGSVVCYRELAGLLAAPVYAFEASEAGPTLPDKLEDLADLYVRALLATEPHGPVRIGGWSSGAVIAAEIVHQLENRGIPVDLLAVIDAPAPVACRTIDDTQLALWFIEDLDLGFRAEEVGAAQIGELAGLPPEHQLRRAVELMHRQGAGLELAETDLARAFAVFQRVVRACNGYVAPRLAADIAVVRAQQQVVSEFAGHPGVTAPDWGWSSLTDGQVTARTLTGTHHTLLVDTPTLTAVAEAIDRG